MFSVNGMVANPDKFQAIFPGTDNESITIKVGQNVIASSRVVKLLGVKLDTRLTFYPHVVEMCKRASVKIKALMRIRGYLSQAQAEFLFNAFIMSNFDYCPLVWMFCSKLAHNLNKSIHHKALCARSGSFTLPYEQLLKTANKTSIHTRNLKLLVTEVYKSLHHLNPDMMWESFKIKPETYNLRGGVNLQIPIGRSSRTINSFEFRAALAWNH